MTLPGVIRYRSSSSAPASCSRDSSASRSSCSVWCPIVILQLRFGDLRILLKLFDCFGRNRLCGIEPADPDREQTDSDRQSGPADDQGRPYGCDLGSNQGCDGGLQQNDQRGDQQNRAADQQSQTERQISDLFRRLSACELRLFPDKSAELMNNVRKNVGNRARVITYRHRRLLNQAFTATASDLCLSR